MRASFPRRSDRFAASVSTAAAAVVGLCASRAVAPTLAPLLSRSLGLARLQEHVAWGKGDLLGQFSSYLLALGFAIGAAAVAAWATGCSMWLRRRGPLLFSGVALLCTAAISIRLAIATIFVILVGATLIAPFAGEPENAPPPSPPRTLALAALAVAALASSWSWWVVLSPRAPRLAVFGGAALLALGLARAARLALAAKPDDDALRLDALTALPLLATPLLGLWRAPSPLWLLAALVCCALARAAYARALAESAARFPERLLAVLAPWSIGVIAVIPLGLRDLPSANHLEHEAQHLGWINSALHGKLLMADAGTIYAPLREYALLAYGLATEVTLEQVRVAAVLMNLGALALCLGLSFELAERRMDLHALGAYLLVVFTPLRFFLDYKHTISFGWADLARTAIPAFAVLGATRAAAAGASRVRLCAWGAVAGVSALYSHEFGLCAVGAIGLAVAAERLLGDRSLPRGQRALRACVDAAVCTLGAAVPIALLAAGYSAAGRGALLARTSSEILLLASSGVLGATPFPITAASFASPLDLLEPSSVGGLSIEYAVAPALFVIAGAALASGAIAGRWTVRSTPLLGVLLLGVASFRVPLSRADVFHLSNAAVPAILVAIALLAEAGRWTSSGARKVARLSPRAALVLGAAALGAAIAGPPGGLSARIGAVARGEERPSSAAPYAHPELPRAGDVRLPADTERLVAFVRRATNAGDAIFCRVGFMTGPELYFLADRRDPTRFDMLAELVTTREQEETAESLARDPPALVIGTDTEHIGPAAASVLADYAEVARFGDIGVGARK